MYLLVGAETVIIRVPEEGGGRGSRALQIYIYIVMRRNPPP